MKKLATAIAAIALIGTPAFAADMPVKAPAAPMPAPVYNWTGWYVGVNAGASMGEAKTNLNGSPVFATGFTGAGVPLGTSQITPGVGINDKTYPDGFIGGGQIGYNFQYSPLIVVGLEADFQGSLEKAEANNFTNDVDFLSIGSAACGTGGGFSTTHCTAVTSYSTQIDWFGTVRGRLGYVWGNGEVLTYVTGGLAYGEVKINATNIVSGPASIASCGCNFNFSNTQMPLRAVAQYPTGVNVRLTDGRVG